MESDTYEAEIQRKVLEQQGRHNDVPVSYLWAPLNSIRPDVPARSGDWMLSVPPAHSDQGSTTAGG